MHGTMSLNPPTVMQPSAPYTSAVVGLQLSRMVRSSCVQGQCVMGKDLMYHEVRFTLLSSCMRTEREEVTVRNFCFQSHACDIEAGRDDKLLSATVDAG